jgi:hypothetical protein
MPIMEEDICKKCEYYDPYPCSNSCRYPHKKHRGDKDNPMGNPEAFTYCYYLKQKGKRIPRYYEGICENCDEVFSRYEGIFSSGSGGWNGRTKYCSKCRPEFEPAKPIFTPAALKRIMELYERTDERRDRKIVSPGIESQRRRTKTVEPEPKKDELEEEIYVRPKRRYVLGHAR